MSRLTRLRVLDVSYSGIRTGGFECLPESLEVLNVGGLFRLGRLDAELLIDLCRRVRLRHLFARECGISKEAIEQILRQGTKVHI